MLRKTVTAIILIIGAIWALSTIHPASPVTPISEAGTVSATPVATTLPLCTYEDGSGQMLCAWDASTQGNGMGTDVVAGDCSIGTVGSALASAWCVRLWNAPAMPITYSAMHDEVNGKEMVWNCLDIEWSAAIDDTVREQLNSEGWNLTECFKAHIQ